MRAQRRPAETADATPVWITFRIQSQTTNSARCGFVFQDYNEVHLHSGLKFLSPQRIPSALIVCLTAAFALPAARMDKRTDRKVAPKRKNGRTSGGRRGSGRTREGALDSSQ
jgi:hypothetical protein